MFALLGFIGVFLNKSPDEAAEEINQLQRNIYRHDHKFAPAHLEDFPRLDHEYYARTQRWLEARGFRHLGDVQDPSAAQAMPLMSGCIRVMVSDDGQIMAGVYDVSTRGLMRVVQLIGLVERNLRTIDFETEFADGTFHTTSNAESAGRTDEFTGVTRRFFKRDDDPETLLADHRAHIASLQSPPRVHRTMTEVLASQQRLHLLKVAHKERHGFVTAEEIERIVGRPLQGELRDVAQRAEELGKSQRYARR